MSTALSHDDIRARLTTILAEILVLKPSDVRADSRLVDDLDADSITFLELTYRIREDFGLQVPEAKVNEEALNRPLIDGMNMVEQAIGGTSLFEFMNAETSRAGVVDVADLERIESILSANDLAMLPTLRGLIEDAYEDPDGCLAVASILGPLQASGAAPLLDALRQDPSFAAKLQHMQAIATEEAEHHSAAAAADIFSIWRRLAGTERARQRAEQLTVGQLAAMMRSPLPGGSAASDPVSALRLRDLFRFITVDSYVRYVAYLQDAQERIRAAGGADAMNAEVTARLRAAQ